MLIAVAGVSFPKLEANAFQISREGGSSSKAHVQLPSLETCAKEKAFSSVACESPWQHERFEAFKGEVV